ncbi:MAG: HEPN domain-containing protein [Thermodesulfobacteriota bacterium]
MKQEITDRFALNITRVKNLVAIYKNLLAGQGKGRRGHKKTDVLRAATVLLHASVEDVLRSLAYWKLPTAPATALENIPFVGGTATKITLGILSSQRGKSVDDVIKESVHANLERSNYNNAKEICSLLESIGLNTLTVQPYLQQLEDAMRRRHQIVHRADANQNAGRGHHQVTSIAPKTVDGWVANAEQFIQTLLNQV